MLEVAYPNLDAVDAFYVRDGQVLSQVETGDRSLFSERAWPHRNFIFPLDSEAEFIYLRVQTSTSMQVPLLFWDADQFSRHDQGALLRQGIFLGVLIVMALYNLFIFAGTRETSFILLCRLCLLNRVLPGLSPRTNLSVPLARFTRLAQYLGRSFYQRCRILRVAL